MPGWDDRGDRADAAGVGVGKAAKRTIDTDEAQRREAFLIIRITRLIDRVAEYIRLMRGPISSLRNPSASGYEAS